MRNVATPVGGPLFTPFVRWTFFVALAGLALIAWRFAVGLGPSTALNDGYTWGIWIAFDVVTGTALACGGYAIAFLAYVLNRGRYHPLVRPAMLTSAVGYSVAGLAIAVDVGRPWLIHRIPFSPAKWNLNSALLEVALCVITYIIVLWIELSPAFFDRWERDGSAAWAGFARRAHRVVDAALPWIIALGLLLPTMHQSSLGTVILLAGPRLHPLWHTAWLPLLFLVSCIAMGYAMVVVEATLSARAFGRRAEDNLLKTLATPMSLVLAFFLLLRFVDLFVAGKGSELAVFDLYTAFFWLEALVLLGAIFQLRRASSTPSIAGLWRAAMLVLFFGVLYRFDAYLVAFQPGEGYHYFPSIPEMAITVGLVSIEIFLYVALVKRFPILSGVRTNSAGR